MADELRHKDVVSGRITEDEYEGVLQHILNDGVDGDFIYWDTATGGFKKVAHTSELDAHIKNRYEILRTGEYYSFTVSTTSTRTLVADTLYAQPFVAIRDITVDRIAVNVQTLDAGSSCRMGIYNNGTNLYPGTLLLDAGTVATATTGIKAITINQALAKGIYWLAIVSDGVPKIYGSPTANQLPSLMGMLSTGFRYDRQQWKVGHVYAALPDPYTAAGTLDLYCFRQALRVASLD